MHVRAFSLGKVGDCMTVPGQHPFGAEEAFNANGTTLTREGSNEEMRKEKTENGVGESRKEESCTAWIRPVLMPTSAPSPKR